MKTPPHRLLRSEFHAFACVFGLAICPSIHAETATASASPNGLIPDGNDSGLVSVLEIPSPKGLVEKVQVTLDIEGTSAGGWNGDLYVYLAHGGVLSVLVNRPGVSSSNAFGYGDNGLNQVTFDDSGALGDFHVYQSTLGLGDTDQPVTGIFQPDARSVDPNVVIDSDPRDAFLSVFKDRPAEGEWRLFVADLSPGGEFRLAKWKLDVDIRDRIAIPESGATLWLGSLVLALGLASARRRST